VRRWPEAFASQRDDAGQKEQTNRKNRTDAQHDKDRSIQKTCSGLNRCFNDSFHGFFPVRIPNQVRKVTAAAPTAVIITQRFVA